MSKTPSDSSSITAVRRAALAVAILLVVATGLGVVRAAASSFGGGSSPPSTAESRMHDAGAESDAAYDAGSARTRVARVALGRAIFFDTNLSVPAGTSCASCHDPARGFAGNHGSSSGVPLGSRPHHFARRSTPSVLYLPFVRQFHLHWEEDAPLVDAYGGFFWDGRTDSLVDLIKQPLLNPDEMNGGDAARVRTVVAASAYAAEFRKEFGNAIDDPGAILTTLGEAVSAYLGSPAMSPFTSKYDDFVRRRASLSPAEGRGASRSSRTRRKVAARPATR